MKDGKIDENKLAEMVNRRYPGVGNVELGAKECVTAGKLHLQKIILNETIRKKIIIIKYRCRRSNQRRMC